MKTPLKNLDYIINRLIDLREDLENTEEIDPLNLSQSTEQIYKNYRAVIDEYNKLQEKHDELQFEFEQLQNLFYKVDSELDELKVKYDQCQDNYRTVVKALKEQMNSSF